AHHPEVAVLVAPRAVAREVDAGEAAEVLALVALVVAPHRAQHAGPGPRDHQHAALVRARLAAVLSEDLRLDAGQGQAARAGLRGDRAGQRRHHDRAGLRLPPRVHDRAALAADDAVVPHPGLRVDRLADGPEQAER